MGLIKEINLNVTNLFLHRLYIICVRAKTRNYQRDGPMTVDSNQEGMPNYFPNSFMGPMDSLKWKQLPIQVSVVYIIWIIFDKLQYGNK